MKKILILALASLVVLSVHAEPKKLLVVTTTTGFRHSSIPHLEKMLTQLSKTSGGEFTVDFVQQPPGRPATGFPAKLKKDATPEEKAAYDEANAKWEAVLKTELQKLSPENLKNYDGVVFASTTGDLPLPDRQGFLDWIKAGHAFIGIHAASDTFHGYPDFIAMLGGEFARHGKQTNVLCLNQEPMHPANAHFGGNYQVDLEEIYQFKNYDTTKVKDLLILDKHPENGSAGHFPVSWCKSYGAGKVFYTSLGHREDIIDTDAALKDRKNPVSTAQAFQMHVLGGIRWALGTAK